MKNLQLNSIYNKIFSIYNIIALLSFGILIFSFSSCMDKEGLSGMISNDNPCIFQSEYLNGTLNGRLEVIDGTDEYKIYIYEDGIVSDIFHVKHNTLAREWTIDIQEANGEDDKMIVYKYSSDPYKPHSGEYYNIENSTPIIFGSIQMTHNENSSCSLTHADIYNEDQNKIGSVSIDYIDQNCSQKITRTLYNPENGQVIGSNLITKIYDSYRKGLGPYDPSQFERGVVDHNIISEEEDGVLVFEATYTYNEQGYPISYIDEQGENHVLEYSCE